MKADFTGVMRSDSGCRPGAPYWTLHRGRKGGDVTEAFTRRPNPRARPASGPHLSKLHRLPVAAQIKEEPDIQPWDRKTWLQRICSQKNVSIGRSRGRHHGSVMIVPTAGGSPREIY